MKNRSTLDWDGTVIGRPFLPSTVLTASGSRGLWKFRLPIFDFRFAPGSSTHSIPSFKSAIGNRKCPRLSAVVAPPKACSIIKRSIEILELYQIRCKWRLCLKAQGLPQFGQRCNYRSAMPLGIIS